MITPTPPEGGKLLRDDRGRYLPVNPKSPTAKETQLMEAIIKDRVLAETAMLRKQLWECLAVLHSSTAAMRSSGKACAVADVIDEWKEALRKEIFPNGYAAS